ncbi:uncharacterized protein LOC133199787 [Saccostrea echinata]|uniref:uncharacterized protein LOC133199787 n=1 Tax=Saccostrea echinata TaxID=191078 RepID=UPI002A83A112|nr:uncharacterized protein LOC133199787 [Saccostrea echinata]
MSIVLKQKHSLLGKNLLPLALRLKDVEIQDERELARLKKEHPLSRYSLGELENEFKSLTGEEAKVVLSLVRKQREIDNIRLLVHVAICMANDAGVPTSTPIARSSILVEPGSRLSTSQSVESREGEVFKELKDGEKKKDDKEMILENIESAMKEVTGNTDKEVNLALKNISILASRPKLTAPALMLPAVESLVDIAISSGHKEADYYAKVLQTCRKFENYHDIFGLCQRLFGTDDKKISSVVSEWSKNKKYLDENKESKEKVN